MRILLENNFYYPDIVGGAELSVQGIAEQLALTGNDVAVLTTGNHDEDTALNGVSVFRRRFRAFMPYGEHVAAPRSVKKAVNKVLAIQNPANAKTVREVLGKYRAEVMLSNNLLGVTPELWTEAHRSGIPIMHTTRDYALLCPNSTLVCKNKDFCDNKARIPCKVMRMVLKRASCVVNTVCAPSHYTLNMHVGHGFFSQARTCVIGNAVAFDENRLARIKEERRHRSAARPLRVAYLGRLTEEKGVQTLVDAVRGFPHSAIEVHFAGSGPLEETLGRLSQGELPLYLHGFLNQEEVSQLLEYCDILVAPSKWPEPFGRIVLDAYAHAMPTIVSRIGGLPEVVEEGAGAVVTPGDANELHMVLGDYVSNRALVCEQGLVAADLIGQHTVKRQASAFLDELERLVN